MDKERFEETDKLYDLYDAYYSFKSLNIGSIQSELCNHITDVVQKYNELIINYKDIYSKHLFNKLYVLKCLIEKYDLVSNDACLMGDTDLLSPKPYSSYTSESCDLLEKELGAESLSVSYPNASLVFPNEECDQSSESYRHSCSQVLQGEYEELLVPEALETYAEPGTEGPGSAQTGDMQFGKVLRVDGNLETGDLRSGPVERKSTVSLESPGKPTSAGLEETEPELSNEPAELVSSNYNRGDESTAQVDRIANLNGDPSKSVMHKNVGTVGATLAGSSLFLLMMYKYTPLGSWVSTKILRKDKLMENMKKNNYELLLNDLGNREMGLNDTMYHISYNSATKQ
ncbi:unnamed protein product [Plasmodium vivax]|nr:unnamed protein product [Plasmodium vivax]